MVGQTRLRCIESCFYWLCRTVLRFNRNHSSIHGPRCLYRDDNHGFFHGRTLFAFLWWLDRNEPEDVLLLAAFFWGAFVSTAISGIFNDAFGAAMMSVVGNEALAGQPASLSAPFIEKLTKGWPCWSCLLFSFVSSTICLTASFTAAVWPWLRWFENIMYYMKPFMEEGGSAAQDWGQMACWSI